MNLEEHPFMRYRGAHSWPPTWVWRGVGENKHPTGEVGVLQEVRPTVVAGERFYLIIEYEGAEYMGTLLIQDYSFCQHIYDLLLEYCGRSIQEIGDIDLTHML